MRWNMPGASTGRPKSKRGNTLRSSAAGPAGLTTAYFLRQGRHTVTVFDRLPEAGGMLTYSIPAYRLPKAVVREQVKALEGMGIRFELGADVGGDGLTLEDLPHAIRACFWRRACGTGSRCGWNAANCSTPACNS